jgi:2-keto-4-pentenoate hydratase
MTLPPALAALVDRLARAHATGTPADDTGLAPPSPEDADRALHALAARCGWWPAGGAGPGHWKSGGPARDAALAHAPLPPAGVSAASADPATGEARAPWPALPFGAAGLEPEIALRLARPVSAAEAAVWDPAAPVPPDAGLIDGLCVSIELVTTRWARGGDTAASLRRADLQSHAALVTGPWLPWDAARLAAHDWAAQACTVTVDGEVRAAVRGSHALGRPDWGLAAWLRHATTAGWYAGGTVPAGTVVTTGSWAGLVPATPGAAVRVEFGGLGALRLG